MARKRKRKSHVLNVILTVLILAAAAAGIYWYLRMRGSKSADPGQVNPMLVTQDSTAVVARGTIRQAAEGSGMLEPEKEITVTADSTLTVSSVAAKAGDTVAEGDVIAAVDVESAS